MYGVNEDNAQNEYEKTKKDIMQELKREFRPEFINRIDEIVVFHKLQNEDMKKIIDLMLNELLRRLDEQGIIIEIDESVKDYIMKQGMDKNYGARPLRREIQNIVEDNITDNILNGNIVPYKKKVMIEKNGEFIFE